MEEYKWNIKRHCFRCQTVEPFFYCGNCSKYFCVTHHEWGSDYDEFKGLHYTYPFHRDCL